MIQIHMRRPVFEPLPLGTTVYKTLLVACVPTETHLFYRLCSQKNTHLPIKRMKFLISILVQFTFDTKNYDNA